MDDKSDQDIVAGTHRNKKEFSAIIRRYDARLLRYVKIRGCREPRIAQNIVQDVFIKAYIYLNDYDGSMPFSTWMYRIAYEETGSFMKKSKPSLDNALKEEDLWVAKTIVDGLGIISPEGAVTGDVELLSAVNQLAEECRDVIILKYVVGMPAIQTAHILRQKESKIDNMIKQAEESVRGYFVNSKRIDHAG